MVGSSILSILFLNKFVEKCIFNELLLLYYSVLNLPYVCTCVCAGTLQVRYSLGGLIEPYTIDVDHRNMANGQPHSVNITRNLREIRLQVSTSCHYSCT